jgi:hypothetical protein
MKCGFSLIILMAILKVTGQVMECPSISENSEFPEDVSRRPLMAFDITILGSPIYQVLSCKHEK